MFMARPNDRVGWLEQVGDQRPVACADGVTERLMEVSLLGIPLAGTQCKAAPLRLASAATKSLDISSLSVYTSINRSVN
jgi:hypothetical protein